MFARTARKGKYFVDSESQHHIPFIGTSRLVQRYGTLRQEYVLRIRQAGILLRGYKRQHQLQI